MSLVAEGLPLQKDESTTYMLRSAIDFKIALELTVLGRLGTVFLTSTDTSDSKLYSSIMCV